MKSRLGDVISNIIAIAVFAAGMATFLAIADARQAPPQPPAAAVELAPTDEVQKLKLENLKLRTAMLQTQWQQVQQQVQEAGAKLDADWKALEAELRAALKPPADYTFDKQKGAFAPPPTPDKKPTP